MAQWTLDERKALGMNDTVDPEVLSQFRPTLRKSNETEAKAAPPATKPSSSSSGSSSSSSSSSGSSGGPPKRPKALKEDVVFEVNAGNFQQVVMESPVPVLVDVYADWCGPCKQLGPILEEAAINAGGMFRLAKLNSDNEKSLAGAMAVQGLPTVFTVKNGKYEDRFVGMLPQDDLQTFLVRAVTGYGNRVQTKDFGSAELLDATAKVGLVAGLAGISTKRKALIDKLVSDALDLPGGYSDERRGLSEGAKIALKYISNCKEDIRNPKFRSFSRSAKVFREKISGNKAALKLLEVAGFLPRKADAGSSEGVEDGEGAKETMELVHSNPAILTLVLQKIDEKVNQKKFHKITNHKGIVLETKAKVAENRRKELERKYQQAADTTKQSKPVKAKAKGTTVTFRPASGGRPQQVVVDKTTLLRDAMEQLHAQAQGQKGKAKGAAYAFPANLEIIQPGPRTLLSAASPQLDMRVSALAGKGTEVVLVQGSVASAPRERKRPPSPPPVQKKGGTHTVFSTGIISGQEKKHREFFGGDSTVTQAGDSDDDEDEEEDETDDEDEDDDDDDDEEDEDEEDDIYDK